LAAIGTPLTLAEYNEAIARIEQLVAAERAIASHEMDEAHVRKATAAYEALAQLLHEAVQAGFDNAQDYNWPRAIADARAALAKAVGEQSTKETGQ
jgi:hypothetical protein